MNIHAVSNKIEEADFFFEKLKKASLDTQLKKERNFYLSAFLSAARSFTFVLQKMCKNNTDFPEFDSWYEKQLKKFTKYEFSDYFKEFRNIALKEGELGLAGGSIYTNENDESVSEILIKYESSQFKNIKIPENFLEESYQYLKILVSIYWDFIVDFGVQLDPWRVHTIKFLKKANGLESDLIYSAIKDHEVALSQEVETNKLFSTSKPHESVDELFEKYLDINRFK